MDIVTNLGTIKGEKKKKIKQTDQIAHRKYFSWPISTHTKKGLEMETPNLPPLTTIIRQDVRWHGLHPTKNRANSPCQFPLSVLLPLAGIRRFFQPKLGVDDVAVRSHR